jgi:polysaccharide biosynthesis protein PelC
MESEMNPRRWNRPLAVALLALLACAGGRKARYQDAQMDFGAIRSVAVMPFMNLTKENVAAERVRDVFSNMVLATGAFYVVPYGEVVRAVGRSGVTAPTTPATEDVVKLGKQLQVGAVFVGAVKEYGEIRSGTTAANVVAVSVQLIETDTGRVVWSASSTKGGLTMTARLFGSSAAPLNGITEEAVDDLLEQLFE